MSEPNTTTRWHTFYEIGVLTGHPEPADFANWMIADPCSHDGAWFFDGDVPCQCGEKHWCCSACMRPMRPICPLIEAEEPATPSPGDQTGKDPS
jgi:hypothetical protein